MNYQIATITYPGTREINEDAVEVGREGDNCVLVVADGLGGHEKGEVASAIVAKEIVNNIHFGDNQVEELEQALEMAQEALIKKQKEENMQNDMKTTAVALSLVGDKAYFAYVGDSRGYVFFNNNKYQRTTDHSVTQMLALAGEIKEKDIRHHSERSSLLRVFGIEWEKPAYEELGGFDLKDVKAFLLCSDGFWELITEKEMIQCLKKSKTPDEWLGKMVTIIEKNGSGLPMDNYTAGAIMMRKKGD